MNRLSTTGLALLILLMSGCNSSGPDAAGADDQSYPATRIRNINRLLLEASRSYPPESTEKELEAARRALKLGETQLSGEILATTKLPYVNEATTRKYSFLRAEQALIDQNPNLAISTLNDPRMLALKLDTQGQVTLGKLKATAYRMGQSYLASARELVYINRELTGAERQENHDAIFSTLLVLSEDVLEKRAGQSIISDMRGWLSLTALTKRFQDDAQQQLSALEKWRFVWSSHPAATLVPTSLRFLSEVVAERPTKIALLLPQSGSLGGIGRAIRDGYIAAHYQFTPDSRIKFYDSSQGDILEILDQAVADGAEIVVGPLDREKVNRVAQHSLDIPVISLNRTPDGATNPRLYQFGLAPEDESIQVARQVYREGHLNGLVIAPDNDWGDRNFNAFTTEFERLGGRIVDSARFENQRDYSSMVKSLLNIDFSEQRLANLQRTTGEQFEFSARRRQDIDFVFLLSNATQARGIKPTLAFFYAEDIPVYATSHVNLDTDSRMDSIDLNGIRFCDMPWKLSGESRIQQIIASTWSSIDSRLIPFYALGVDVHRLYPRLEQLKKYPEERIYGATGVLSLNESNIVTRELIWAQFHEGRALEMSRLIDL